MNEEERAFEEAIRGIGLPPGLRQVGWMDRDRFHREWWSPDDVPVFVLDKGEPAESVAQTVQELERCPTCGSGDRKRQWSPCKWRQEADADPWHSTAAPDVSASTDQ